MTRFAGSSRTAVREIVVDMYMMIRFATSGGITRLATAGTLKVVVQGGGHWHSEASINTYEIIWTTVGSNLGHSQMTQPRVTYELGQRTERRDGIDRI